MQYRREMDDGYKTPSTWVHGDGTVQSTSIQYILKDSGYRRRRCEVYQKVDMELWLKAGMELG
jgi:hypothetical protein